MTTRYRLTQPIILVLALLSGRAGLSQSAASTDNALDHALADRLREGGFTGNVDASFRQRLGRPIDPARANLGRLLWFDTLTGLNNDNTCAGCHSPTRGFGDTQSIAIGIGNNGIVGPHRTGPRNQRRTPMAINTVLYPNLMWNSRFASLSDDPFDNSMGFQFPPPEPAFFHNGCFTRLEDAVRFHLDVFNGARSYDPVKAGVAEDLAHISCPVEPVLARVDPLLTNPILLSDTEFNQLIAFIREGLLDKGARPANLRNLVPHIIPSGRPALTFEFDDRPETK